MAVRKHALRQFGAVVAADGENREVSRLLDRGGLILQLARSDPLRRNGHVHRLVGPTADVDVVGPLLLEHLDRGQGLLDGDATVKKLGPREPVADDVVGPHGLADGADALAREPEPVLQRAAVVVGPRIRVRRDEGVMQVAVGGVELNVVESRLLCPHRGGGELLTDLGDPADAQLNRSLTEQRLRDRRGSFRLELIDVVGRRLASRVG